MLVELGLLSSSKFKSEQKDTVDSALTIVTIILGIYLLVLLWLWFRVVRNAYRCSGLQCLSSIFFMPQYMMWKFADLQETVTCPKSKK